MHHQTMLGKLLVEICELKLKKSVGWKRIDKSGTNLSWLVVGW